jgi:serine/threonine protein kinase
VHHWAVGCRSTACCSDPFLTLCFSHTTDQSYCCSRQKMMTTRSATGRQQLLEQQKRERQLLEQSARSVAAVDLHSAEVHRRIQFEQYNTYCNHTQQFASSTMLPRQDSMDSRDLSDSSDAPELESFPSQSSAHREEIQSVAPTAHLEFQDQAALQPVVNSVPIPSSPSIPLPPQPSLISNPLDILLVPAPLTPKPPAELPALPSSPSPLVAASSEPASSSAAIVRDAEALPMNILSRYTGVKEILSSIYGRAVLCTDNATGAKVVIKESSDYLIQQLRNDPEKEIGEDVRKEARILRWLGLDLPNIDAPLPHLENKHVDLVTCGLSDGWIQRHSDGAGGLNQAGLDLISTGAPHITPLLGEFRTIAPLPLTDRTLKTKKFVPAPRDAAGNVQYSHMHFLVTPYACHGDLFDAIRNHLGGWVPEKKFRPLFRQIVLAVMYIHARSVAHLDLDIENTVINEKGQMQLIDFGVATPHPLIKSAPMGAQNRETLDPQPKYLPINMQGSTQLHRDRGDRGICTGCKCGPAQLSNRVSNQVNDACRHFPLLAARVLDQAPSIPRPLAASEMEADDEAVREKVIPTVQQALHARCKMMMRPVCSRGMTPGKPNTTSNELRDTAGFAPPWDAYAADSFQLGVLLCSALTGLPPFERAGDATDALWNAMLSGHWLKPEYLVHHARLKMLTGNARDLLNMCFKPQHLRPTVDQILEHPWMNETHPGSVQGP